MGSVLTRTGSAARKLGRPLGVAAFATGLATTAAHAQNPVRPGPAPGFMDGFSSGTPYIGIAGGPTLLQNVGVNPGDGPFGPGPAKERFNVGGIGAGAIGYAFSNGVQIDILGAYEYNDFNNLVPVPGIGQQFGHQESYGAFLEALYAFKLPDYGMNITAFSPYLGVGAGALWTHVTGPEYLSNGDYHHIAGTSGANFAYEGIAGVAVPIPAIPGLAFTTDYRLVGIHNAGDLNSVFYNKVDNVIVKGGIGLQKDIFVHTITVGFAYAFGAPPPPPEQAAPMPVAAPAPAPARTYLVFFDWDRSDLTQRARQIIAEAASASTHVETTKIAVDGYTDLSGTAAYNQRLSVRRAMSVQAELIRDGVARGEISIHGFGESNPLVPTAQGVREPQNRRVEIILK
jgi:OOP family OmpA-OmpF porin